MTDEDKETLMQIYTLAAMEGRQMATVAVVTGLTAMFWWVFGELPQEELLKLDFLLTAACAGCFIGAHDIRCGHVLSHSAG